MKDTRKLTVAAGKSVPSSGVGAKPLATMSAMKANASERSSARSGTRKYGRNSWKTAEPVPASRPLLWPTATLEELRARRNLAVADRDMNLAFTIAREIDKLKAL